MAPVRTFLAWLHVLRTLWVPENAQPAPFALVLLMLAVAACSSTPASTGGRATPTVEGVGGGKLFWNSAGTGGADSAIAWASSFQFNQMNYASSDNYNGWCLAFVANAYGSQYAYYNTAWDMAKAYRLNDPTNPAAAPRGALVFFDLSRYGISAGHVGISIGGGAMISALEHRPVVQITSHLTTDTYWGPTYRGWSWPPAKWGPLAAQAAAGTSGGPATPTATTRPQPPTVTPTTQKHQPTPPTATPTKTPTLSPTVTPKPTPPPPPIIHYFETAGPGGSGTFTNYTNAGGTLGPRVAAYATIEVSCRLTGWTAPDGDNWWYRVASGPWSNAFYASADNYYNNGHTSGGLSGTPFYDANVPLC